jgi:hypothetical protein
MITREEFHAECDKLQKQYNFNHINNKIQENKNKMKKNLKDYTIGVVIVWCFILLMTRDLLVSIMATMMFSSFGYVVIAVIFSGTRCEISKYKIASQIIDILLKGYKYTYSPRSYIEESIYMNSPLWKLYKNYKGEDLLTIDIPNDDGTPSGVYLRVCDLDTSTGSIRDFDNDGDMIKEDGFVGAFGYIKFPYEFKCDLGINCSAKGLKKLELEDMNFNEKFYMFTDNHFEAVMIINPRVMQKLIDFSNKYSEIKIFIKKNGELYFSINRNLFEIKNYREGQSFNVIFDRFYDDMKTILGILEEIKNNNKIFKM